MELVHLKGKTYYITGVVNIGLYKFDAHNCLLIDTGYGGNQAAELIQFLKNLSFNVTHIINTHGHRDHMGGNNALVSEFKCKVFASKYEDTFIERPDFTSMFVYPSAPFKMFSNAQISGSKVDTILPDEGIVTIGFQQFEIVNLAGHSPNQIGIVTPDDVFFTADAYVCKTELENIKILYSYDLTKDLLCKQKLLKSNYSLYVPTHGKPTDDLKRDIQDNIAYYKMITHAVKGFLCTPKSLDELMKDALSLFGITPKLDSYMVGRGCISGIISHLERIDEIEILISDGIMKFKLK